MAGAGDGRLADFAAPPDTKPTVQGLRLGEGALGRTKSPLCATLGVPTCFFPTLINAAIMGRGKNNPPPSPQPLPVVFVGQSLYCLQLASI